MAIHINLLHEQKTQEKQAERDPLKLGLLAMLVVAGILGGLYTWKLSGTNAVKAERDDALAALDKLKPRMAQYDAEKTTLEAKIAVQSELIRRVEERFFWAPSLEVLTRQTPAKVQIIQLAGAANTENVTLSIKGVVADAQPLDAADKLRTGLIEQMEKYYDNVAGEFTDLKEHGSTIKYDNADLNAADFAILLKLNRPAAAPEAAVPAK